MVKHELDVAAAAVSSAPRRAVIERLATGPASMTELAEVHRLSGEARAAGVKVPDLDAAQAVDAADQGVTTDAQGRMVDLAVVRAARETLARARA